MLSDASVFFVFTVSSPLFSLIVPETDAAPMIDYIDETSSFSAELPGKQTLVEYSDIAHFFPSHACIRTATAFCMILL